MDDYDTPGNYYVADSTTVRTLKNAPFTTAFTLKVEYANGTAYPCQTFTEFTSGKKAWRLKGPSGWSGWSDYVYFSDDATLLGQTITHSTYSIYEKQTMMIEENGDSFYQLVVFRGSVGNGYNAVLLTGYGIGTDTRYHYKLLDDGSAISISISDTSFVIKNEVQAGLVARIFNLYGNSPTVSVS